MGAKHHLILWRDVGSSQLCRDLAAFVKYGFELLLRRLLCQLAASDTIPGLAMKRRSRTYLQ
jgi:hypothetical protein